MSVDDSLLSMILLCDLMMNDDGFGIVSYVLRFEKERRAGQKYKKCLRRSELRVC